MEQPSNMSLVPCTINELINGDVDHTPTIAILYHSTFGRIEQMTIEFARGVENAGGRCVLLQIPDLTPLDTGKPLVLGERPEETTRVPGLEDTTMGALTIGNLQTLGEYDGIAFGITSRFGMMSSQVKAVFDQMGRIWKNHELLGKPATGKVRYGMMCSRGVLVGSFELSICACIYVGYGRGRSCVCVFLLLARF
jgi:multimeric flavodoxin WrbA